MRSPSPCSSSIPTLVTMCIVLWLLHNGANSVVHANDPFAFVAPPSISVETYQAVYCQPRHGRVSDACPYAPQMYQLLVDAGIDPVIELAFAAKETEFGLTGPGRAPQHNIHSLVCNRWDEGSCEGPYHYRFSSYPDYLAALRSWITLLLHRGIYVDAGNDTFREVLPIYAPPSENDTELYIAQVEEWVTRWRGGESSGASGKRRVFQPTNPHPPWWMAYEGVIAPTWGRGHGYDDYDDPVLSGVAEYSHNAQPVPTGSEPEVEDLAVLPGTASFPQNTVIVDERSSGFSASQEPWSIEPCGMGNRSLTTRSTTTQARSTSRASWRASLPTPGYYEVLAYIPDCATTAATRSAHYIVNHDEGMHEVVVDQDMHAGQWVSLGIYSFGNRYPPVVEISDLTDDEQFSVRVDVLAWVPRPDASHSRTSALGLQNTLVREVRQAPDPWLWVMTITHCIGDGYQSSVVSLLCRWEWWAARSGMIYDTVASQRAAWWLRQQETEWMSRYRVPLPPPPADDPCVTCTHTVVPAAPTPTLFPPPVSASIMPKINAPHETSFRMRRQVELLGR